MSYKSETVANTVRRLNQDYFLPAIQREFVWDPDDIVKLFDSLMRAYPIGAFLFWQLDPQNRDRWEIYKFLQNAKDGVHNELAVTDGIPQLWLVLDGQQRLTALQVGLRGFYTIKKKYRRWDDPEAWKRHRLYLDVLHDPRAPEEDGESGIYYSFAFHEKEPVNDAEHHWLRVGRVLDFDSEDAFDDFRLAERDRLPETVTIGQQRIFEKNLQRLYRAVWLDEVIAYHTETEQDYDRVLDIFVRANSQGTPLTKSDLLLSMVISRWGGMSARQEIHGFVDHLNSAMPRNNNFNKDFVMKTCLVLTDLPVAYKVENFSNQNLDQIERKWGSIKDALERTVRLVNQFGIDRDTLTSQNALIPIAYYLLRHADIDLLGSSHFDVANATAIRKWLTVALLNNAFGGQSDVVLRQARTEQQNTSTAGSDFPREALEKALVASGKNPYFDEFSLASFLDITYGRRTAFLAVSLLYDDNNWGTTPHQLDHVFPRSWFTRAKLTELGITSDRHGRYMALADRVSNLQLLTQHENAQKKDGSFAEWLVSRDASFRARHLIPQSDELLSFARFEQFVEERERLIGERLDRIVGIRRTRAANV
jgi:hypothetical protein